MLKSHRLQIEAGELRSKLNGLSETRETKGEHDEGRAKLSKLDHEIAVAIQEEADDMAKHQAENKGQPFGGTAETRELRKLASKGSIDRILRAAVRGWGISDGPEHELQSHFDLDSNVLPLVMLLDDEARAAASFGAAAGTPGTSPGISGQVFGDSASVFANTRFEDVEPGVRIHPVITTGALTSGVRNVSTPAKSAEVTETDAVLAVKELTPKRAQHGFSYTLEDAMTYPGLDVGLRRNLREGLRDKVDEVILNRTDEGLLNFGTAPTAPTAATTAAQYVSAASAVDGRFATRESEVKMVVGETIYAHMAGQALATGDGRTVTDKLGDRVRVSPHVPAYSGDQQQAIVCKGNAFQTVCAICPGLPILVDSSSRAPHGEVRLWAVLMHDFAILRTDGYTRVAFRNS